MTESLEHSDRPDVVGVTPAQGPEQEETVPASMDFTFTTPGEAAAPLAVSDDLEEEVYDLTVQEPSARPSDVVGGYVLQEDLGRGWFTAQEAESGQAGFVYSRPAPAWAELAPHRLLPRWKPLDGGLLVWPVDGVPIEGPLTVAEALPLWTELARLVFALEKQGFTLIDLEPAGLLRGDQGLRLQFPPRVVRTGDAVDPLLREGFTPPEVQEGGEAQVVSGVYLLGAVLYRWLQGAPLPAEGPGAVTLSGVRPPGLPQLLHQALAPASQRLTPTALMDTLRHLELSAPPAYRVTAATTVGLNHDRPMNEDAYGFILKQIDAHGGRQQTLRACVADGMGGMAAGEVASRAAVDGFLGSEASTLEARVWDANAALLSALGGQDGGCAFSAVEIHGTTLSIGHVGDTRVYLLQKDEITQLSKDHSYVAAMVASGMMSAEEAAVSQERNKVLRSLGSVRQPQDHYVQTLERPQELALNARVLLVSDGVWGEVDEAALRTLVREEPDAQQVVDRLIDLALEAGAPDNATALLIERVR